MNDGNASSRLPMKPSSRPIVKQELSSLKLTDKTLFTRGGSILGRVSMIRVKKALSGSGFSGTVKTRWHCRLYGNPSARQARVCPGEIRVKWKEAEQKGRRSLAFVIYAQEAWCSRMLVQLAVARVDVSREGRKLSQEIMKSSSTSKYW